ncbi:pyridoxal-phosphate dependent enzyme [Edaphobacter dinghuensis]|uniref:pyridoxal-phosphate dependent enzyme n=1 Tax=Edaphobacter dinghuensis TaxID=1560005 RepID=UPI0016660BB0|nr:pyridoxal-phosphate dependent enzyme [Edaphobacter dinghuensis]
MPRITSLECSRCHHHVDSDSARTVCPACNGFLFVRYDMEEIKRSRRRPDAGSLGAGIGRYAAVLPEFAASSLGSGGTPLLPSRRFAGLLVKDEGRNPTGSFEDRGMELAVAAAKHYGVQQLSIAAEGEAAASLSAYANAVAIGARVFLPQDVPMPSHLQCVAFGAEVTVVLGSIRDCERKLEQEAKNGFNLSELKEPFRLEGAKTIAYELVEQMGWSYPDGVICPAGIGAVAIWKAFEEMEQLGWVAGRRPRLYVSGSDTGSFESGVLEASGGRVVEGTDALATLLDWARHEGILLSPEGAAGVQTYQALLASGEVAVTDRVVLINGSRGLNYAEVIARALRLRPKLPSSLPVGGIITPQ